MKYYSKRFNVLLSCSESTSFDIRFVIGATNSMFIYIVYETSCGLKATNLIWLIEMRRTVDEKVRYGWLDRREVDVGQRGCADDRRLQQWMMTLLRDLGQKLRPSIMPWISFWHVVSENPQRLVSRNQNQDGISFLNC